MTQESPRFSLDVRTCKPRDVIEIITASKQTYLFEIMLPDRGVGILRGTNARTFKEQEYFWVVLKGAVRSWLDDASVFLVPEAWDDYRIDIPGRVSFVRLYGREEPKPITPTAIMVIKLNGQELFPNENLDDTIIQPRE